MSFNSANLTPEESSDYRAIGGRSIQRSLKQLRSYGEDDHVVTNANKEIEKMLDAAKDLFFLPNQPYGFPRTIATWLPARSNRLRPCDRAPSSYD